jgi:hypothetical protein
MLQWLYTYVTSFCSCFICFLDVCCRCVYLNVAYVSHICCKCFIWMLYSGVFVSVSDACFKCFICLQTYVASVASECFKSRSGVASLSSLSAGSPWCLLLAPARHPPAPPLFSMLGDVRCSVGPVWARETTWETVCRRGKQT